MVGIIIWFGLYEAVIRVYHSTVTNNDHSDTTDAGRVVVGGFEIQGSERKHLDGFCLAAKIVI
jgi:hypothetical protein